MDADVEAYLGQLTSALDDGLSGNLVAVWVAGSLVTSEFRVEQSDIDILVIAGDAVTDDAKVRLTSLLRHARLPSPAQGLDLVVYRESEVRSVRRAPDYEYSIASGREWPQEVSNGGSYPGGILDLAVAQRRGATLRGPGPRDFIGAVPESWIVEELAAAVRWHTTRVHDPLHDPTGSNAVLNTCRALYYLAERAFVSKSTGAEWLLGCGAPEIVHRALVGRATGSHEALAKSDVLLFLDDALQHFTGPQ